LKSFSVNYSSNLLVDKSVIMSWPGGSCCFSPSGL